MILREVTNRIAKYEELKLGLGLHINTYSSKELAEYFIKKTTIPKEGINLTEYARQYIAKLKANGKKGTAECIRYTINSIHKFARTDNIYFSEITVKFLQDYEQWLLNNGVKGRGISLYTGNIRLLFNRARDEYNDDDRGDIQIPNYPFRKYKISQAPQPEKRALAVEQLRAIKNYTPVNTRDALARDIFMLSFYLVGMNSADLYIAPKPSDGRITYNRAKTKDRRADKAKISIKIEPEAQSIIKKYAGRERLLNLCQKYANERGLNSSLNKGLKTIGNTLNIHRLTFYAARHSWATIAVNDCGIPKSDVHEALNHVDEKMKITDVYIRKDWSRIDKANREVLNFLI
ncbi:MAG: site-specific integrase [Prevotellaceae bacterium]|jgi:integrase|nr:site-specific integrase [Prevotellaceae bacterium]